MAVVGQAACCAPVPAPPAVPVPVPPHANFAEIGVTFNDAASKILGGVNASNEAAITNDVNAVIADLTQLMANDAANNVCLFGGLTKVHADTIVQQLQLELTYINQAGINVDAGCASNDNILGIIDMVAGDANLANNAATTSTGGTSTGGMGTGTTGMGAGTGTGTTTGVGTGTGMGSGTGAGAGAGAGAGTGASASAGAGATAATAVCRDHWV
jgi:hypothetical protein